MTTFTQTMRQALAAPLEKCLVGRLSSKAGGKANKPYMSVLIAIEQANMIFDFGGWTSQVLDHQMVFEDVAEDGYTTTGYTATVCVTVGDCFHEGVGYRAGSGKRAAAHELASKGAAADALKRALVHFGAQFGNSLRDKDEDGNDRDILGGGFSAEYNDKPAATPQAAPAPRQDDADELGPGNDPSSMGEPTPEPAREEPSPETKPTPEPGQDGFDMTTDPDLAPRIAYAIKTFNDVDEMRRWFREQKEQISIEKWKMLGEWLRGRAKVINERNGN